MEISKLFVFVSFGKVRFSKFGNFSEITGFLELTKILQKKFGKSSEIISCFWVKKPCFWVKKLGKSLEIIQVRTFQKLQKNDVKLKL